MTFSGFPFLLGFLPLFLCGFAAAGRCSATAAKVWLIANVREGDAPLVQMGVKVGDDSLDVDGEGAVEPFAKTLPAKDGATVYLCTGTACQPPTHDAAKVKAMLK